MHCLFRGAGEPFDFVDQRDFDLHIALNVNHETLHAMFEKGQHSTIETRGISDHSFIDSIYFHDPNGYVIKLAAQKAATGEGRSVDEVKEILRRWQQNESS